MAHLHINSRVEDSSWENIPLLMGIVCGFRLADPTDGSSMRLDKSLAAVGWENMKNMPTLDIIRFDSSFGIRLAEDLPDDGITLGKFLHYILHINEKHYDSSESFMEAVVGLEGYNVLLEANNPEMNRKMLVASWLFIHGILNTDFPAVERFIPGHMEEQLRRKRTRMLNNN